MSSNSLFSVFFISIISIAYPINSESTSQIVHEKYDVTKIVHDTSARISLVKNLNKISYPGIRSLIHELDSFSGENLSPLLTEMLRKNDSNDKCDDDLRYTFENLLPFGGWGTKMLDSYAKPERGIFQGNLHWLGDFNECVGVYAPRKITEYNKTVGDFHGQYCTLTVTAHLGDISLPLSIGTCLPDSCHPTSDKIQLKNQTSFRHIGKSANPIFTDAKLTCQPKFEKFTTAAIFVILLLSVFIFLATAGSLITAYEHLAKIEVNRNIVRTTGFVIAKPVDGDIDIKSIHGDDNDSPNLGNTRKVASLPAWLEQVKPFFNCFCIFTNGAKLLDTSDTEGQLPFLHGIRFLSLSWVIVGHTHAFVMAYVRNIREVISFIDHWPFQIIMNGFYSVDSFFLLSGFLLAYLFFEMSAKNNGKVPWLYFYIHRYVRLTPVYMIMLGFQTTIFSYMGSGPLWTSNEIDKNCGQYWWRNLLYINNFFDATEMCVGWSWYLANDMQFFVISPIILIALWRWMKFFNMVYTKPYTRISPYLVGIGLAYYLYKRRESACGKNSLVTLSLGWLISSGIVLACMFGLYHRHMSVLEMSFYNAFNRTCFAGGLAWVIYVCITGQGGVVNKILSFKLFIPLGRLTYCAYLVHPIVIQATYMSMKAMIEFSHITMVIYFLGFLVLSYGIAFITSLLFESPVIRLDKLVRNKLTKT
ncbi:hypothetical protein JTE90_026891 [Oedothorax gibbosus]|uniref:Nose resistant-to-fluoxetine protein N-terminal domain-containing protein n=1 Tax=Oedothorax gibbosus TaxID=931172 RepID=A0AAV6UC61_9ARAC|nr:hypothetical protein JTE90_026891 [Oedothorax gibbosus]